MKKYVISVSSHSLARSIHYLSYQQIDRSLSDAEWLVLDSQVCCSSPVINIGRSVTVANYISNLAREIELEAGLELKAMVEGEMISTGDDMLHRLPIMMIESISLC